MKIPPHRVSAYLPVARLLLCLLLALAAVDAKAANFTWSGSSTGLWNLNGNWLGGIKPAATGQALIFDGNSSTVYTSTNDYVTSVASLAFANSGTNLWVLKGNALTLNGGVTLGNNLQVQMDMDINLGGAQRLFTAASGGSLLTLNGNISNGIFEKTGAGLTVLSGSNSFSSMVISQLLLQYTTANSLGTGSITLNTNASELVYNGSGNITMANNLIIGSGIPSPGNARLASEGIGGVKYTGILTNSSTTAISFALRGASTAANELASNITDNGANVLSLSKSGAGRWILSGSNSYTGATAINQGVLVLDSANALAGGRLNIIGAGGILGLGAYGDMTRALGTTAGTISLTEGTGFAAYSGTHQVNIGGGASLNFGDTNFVLTTLLLSDATADGTIDFHNNLAMAGSSNTRFFQVADGSATVDAILSGTSSGTAKFEKTGAGALLLTQANTYTGATTVSAGALLVGANSPSGSAGALGNATSAVLLGSANSAASDNIALLTSGAVTVGRNITVNNNNSSGTTTLGGSTDHNSTFSGTVALSRNVNLQSVTTGANAVTFSGPITGSGFGVTKTGVGTVILSGVNTYTGTTAVNTGTLLVNGDNSSATGVVTVAAGAVLGGSGTIGGALTVSGTLSPGNSPGNLTVNNNVSFSTGSYLVMEISGTTVGTQYDRLTIGGAGPNNVSLASNVTLTLSLGFAPTLGDTFTLIDNTTAGAFSGQFANLAPNGTIAAVFSGTSYSFQANNYASGNDLILTVVPEPQAWALAGIGLAAILYRLRRKVRQ